MEVNAILPEDPARTPGLIGPDAPEQARFLLLLGLYRESRLSLGRYAELVEISQAAFLERIATRGFYLSCSLQVLEDDRKASP